MPVAEEHTMSATVARRLLGRPSTRRFVPPPSALPPASPPPLTPLESELLLPDCELPLDPALLLSPAPSLAPAIDPERARAVLIGALSAACTALLVLDSVLLAIYL